MAGKHGFTVVTVESSDGEPGAYNSVQVLFEKP
jgi:hypothetical protein